MFWTILIIVTTAGVLIFLRKQQKQEIESEILNNGGLNKFYDTFSSYVIDRYNMTLLYDTGSAFAYSKELFYENNHLGKLILKVEHDITGEPTLSSILKKRNSEELIGTKVSGINMQNREVIEECIDISLEKIVLNEPKFGSAIGERYSKNTNDRQTISSDKVEKFHQAWESMLKLPEESDEIIEMKYFYRNFYKGNLIDPNKMVQNFRCVRESYLYDKGRYGTPSIEDIFYVPQGISEYFVAGYPDVYKWYSRNVENTEIFRELQTLPELDQELFFNSESSMRRFYKSLINQYLKEGNSLETSMFKEELTT